MFRGATKFRFDTMIMLALVFCAALSLEGCGPLQVRNAVPQESVSEAQISGMRAVRWWGDVVSEEYTHSISSMVDQERDLLKLKPGDPMPPAEFLAISGGGADGAYGAGMLCGWTTKGTRPIFKVVTGVSTGALTAPFAFLGSAYDDKLKEVYTTTSSKQIFALNSVFTILRGDSMASSRPLRELTEKYIDDDVLRQIAIEHAKGRRLLIATTNLDCQRPVVWDMGAIASSGDPGALELFRHVMIASASIPGFFPPVYLKVDVNGTEYDEMHVDAGTCSQVFMYPAALDVAGLTAEQKINRQRRLYIIRNARVAPDWVGVKPRLFPIAGRSISTLIKTQGLGDLFRIYLLARRDDVDYNLAHIPDELKVTRTEEFDTQAMNQLFELGYTQARDGYPWRKEPPGLILPNRGTAKQTSSGSGR